MLTKLQNLQLVGFYSLGHFPQEFRPKNLVEHDLVRRGEGCFGRTRHSERAGVGLPGGGPGTARPACAGRFLGHAWSLENLRQMESVLMLPGFRQHSQPAADLSGSERPGDGCGFVILQNHFVNSHTTIAILHVAPARSQ